MPEAALLSSRAVLKVDGDDAAPFLQGLISNDIAKATETEVVYAVLLTPQGKFLFDFFILAADGGYLMDVEASRAEACLKRLSMYKLRSKVSLEDVSGAYAVAALLDEGGALGFADPRCAAMGRRAVLPAPSAEADLKDAGYALTEETAYHAHRLRLGVPEGGLDILPEKSFPLDANLDLINAVDYQKGCFVGQEVASRTKRKGEARKRTMILTFDGPPPASQTPVKAGDSEIGTVLSGADGQALALIRLDRWAVAEERGDPPQADGAPVTISAPAYMDAP